MYNYRVQVKKVSGSFNESVLPSKSLVVKSKSKKTDEQVFAEASKYFKNKYGLVIESADVEAESFWEIINIFQNSMKIITTWLINPKLMKLFGRNVGKK